MVRLGDVATYVNGFAFKPADWSNKGIPIIRIQNLTGTSDVVNYYDKKYSTKYEINNGDVLISWSASLGVYEWKKGKALLNQHIFKVVFDKLVLDKRFFVFVIAEKLREMSSLVHGSTMKHITKKYFDRIEIQLPPLESQKKIATALDSANALIEKRKEQIEKLDLLIKSQFIEMFGDPVTNPKGWEIKSIQDCCIRIFGGGTPSKQNLEYFTGDIPWVSPKDMKTLYIIDSIDHITKEAVEKSTTNLIPQKSVLMVIRSGILKKYLPVAINNVIITINQDMKAFTPNKNTKPEFLLYCFKAIERDVLSRVRSVTADNIEFSDFKRREIISPPLIVQNQFAEFVEKVEAQKTLLQKSLADMEQNYQSLLQKCFKGEIF